MYVFDVAIDPAMAEYKLNIDFYKGTSFDGVTPTYLQIKIM